MTTQTMTTEQLNYVAAKALYETLSAEATAFSAPYMHLLETDEGIKEFTEREVEFSHSIGLWEAFDNLVAAERAMIEWSRTVVMNHPKTAKKYGKNAKQLNHLYATYTNFPKIREGLIKIALELVP